MRRFELIAGFLIATIVFILSAYFVTSWREAQRADKQLAIVSEALTTKAISTPAWFGHTAKSAFRYAQPIAAEWAEDAQLVSLTANWSPGIDFTVGYGVWTLVFYSPAMEATALLSVSDTRVTIVSSRQQKLDAAHIIDADLWRIDSPAAIDRMMEEGGGAFTSTIGRPTLTMSLKNNGAPTWDFILLGGIGNSYTAQLDAGNGAALSNNP